MDSKTDIAIAGAGLTGRLMALALARQGHEITLIDPAPNGGGVSDARTTALAYACVRLLQRLDLWEPLLPQAGIINDILVTNGVPGDRFRSGGVGGGKLHFPSSLLVGEKEETSPLGYIVENRAMNDVFEHHVQQSDNITTRYGQSVASVETVPGATQLTLSDGTDLRAKLLIGCDGKNSRLRETHGFRTIKRRYDQKAIIFNIEHSEPHHGVAHEMFYPAGPFAILPLPGNTSSIVWTENNAAVDAYMALDDASFLTAARARIGDHLGDIQLSSGRGIYPLSFHYVETPVFERLVLAGDAAHTVHPIAGQGFNLGMKDIAAMEDVLAEALTAGLDIGHGTVLEKYATWRRFDVTMMALGMDAMNRLFSNNLAPIRWVRGLGLGVVNAIDPARKVFMRQAGADLGSLPRLMQPL